MWEGVNTKLVQGALFRIFLSEMMGVPVEYDDDVECRRTQPLIMPKIETETVSLPDGDILEKTAVVYLWKSQLTRPHLEEGSLMG